MSSEFAIGVNAGAVSFEHLDLEGRAQSLADVTVNDISQRYKMQEELGAGAQATVYKGLSRKNNQKVAIKVLDAKELEDDELYDALRMEITLLRQLRHPHIVNLHEVVRTPDRIYIIQECLGGGELFEQLLAKGPFKEDYALAIFAQIVLAVDYMHGLDVVHRDLKAENLVFSAKGSPAIKFIDFGGACTWTPDEGLVGLVGTPQYVAPEVVTGFGEVDPTEKPYGKECDMWSMGVLLYVMLSKTMPFRAKEVDQLLKQVVKGKFSFKPEERWRHISQDARDLISKLIVLDPQKRFSVAQVKEHPWCSDAVSKCAASMPKLSEAATKKDKKDAKGGGGLGFGLFRLGSRAGKTPKGQEKPIIPRDGATPGNSSRDGGGGGAAAIPKRFKTGTDGYASREQQFWYAMEISPPSNMQQQGGVKIGTDGKFQMDNVSEEMRAILEDIERKKQGAAGGASNSVTAGGLGAPPPPPPPPPPGGGTPSIASPEMQRLAVQTEAEIRHRSASDTMDTLLLMGEKDTEIAQLRDLLQEAQARIEDLEAKGKGKRSSSTEADPAAALTTRYEDQIRELTERAQTAEEKLSGQDASLAKLQAKLTAVSTLYTESMQREAVLKVQLDQLNMK